MFIIEAHGTRMLEKKTKKKNKKKNATSEIPRL